MGYQHLFKQVQRLSRKRVEIKLSRNSDYQNGKDIVSSL